MVSAACQLRRLEFPLRGTCLFSEETNWWGAQLQFGTEPISYYIYNQTTQQVIPEPNCVSHTVESQALPVGMSLSSIPFTAISAACHHIAT